MATLEEQIAELKQNPAFEEFKTIANALTNLNPENEAQLTELKTKLAEFESAKAAGTPYVDKAPEPTPEQKADADKADSNKAQDESKKLVIEKGEDEKPDDTPPADLDWKKVRYDALKQVAKNRYSSEPGNLFKEDATRVPLTEQYITVGNTIAHSKNKNLMQLSTSGTAAPNYDEMAQMGVQAAKAGGFYISFNPESGNEFNIPLMIEAMKQNVPMDNTAPKWDSLSNEEKAKYLNDYNAALKAQEKYNAEKLRNEQLKAKIADIKASRAVVKDTAEGDYNKTFATKNEQTGKWEKSDKFMKGYTEEDVKTLRDLADPAIKHVRELRGIASDTSKSTKERLEAQAELNAARTKIDPQTGKPKFLQEELMYEREVEKDDKGNTKYEPLKDKDGNIIQEEVKEKGKVVKNPDGTPKMQDKPDTKKPIYQKNSDGSWKYVMEKDDKDNEVKKLSDYGKVYTAKLMEHQANNK